jgi:hypothetical protein
MATFRKRYRSKNRRRNTRKSHIKKRGKKLLVGGTDPTGTDPTGTDATFTKTDMLKIVTDAVTQARVAMKAAIEAEEKAASAAALAAETGAKSDAASDIKNGVNIVAMMMNNKFHKQNENINIENRGPIDKAVTSAEAMMREKTAFTRKEVIDIANSAVRRMIRDTIGHYISEPQYDVLVDDLSVSISSYVNGLADSVINTRASIAAKTAANAVLDNI